MCYSVKSNSNLAVLNLLGRAGSGFDIVSGGELLRVLAAGGDPRKVIFSGVGKGREEMRLALVARHPLLQRRIDSRAAPLERSGRRHGPARAGVAARQSRRRRQDPSLHLDRAQGKQVRRRLRRRAGLLPHRGGTAAHRGGRHRLPYRLAVAGRRAAAGSAGQGDRTDRPAGGGRHPGASPRHRRRHRHHLRRRAAGGGRRLPGAAVRPRRRLAPTRNTAARRSRCCSSRAARSSATPASC